MPDLPQLLSVKETCRQLGVGKTFIYRLIGEGALQKVKIGGRSLVTSDSVRRLVDANKQPPKDGNPAPS